MELIPRWTKKGKLKIGGRDPLGLSRISERITSDLVPGIITMTRIARNYIFYCWSIYIANQKKVKGLGEYKKILAKLEATWVIAGLLDDKLNNREGKGAIGKLRSLRRIRKSENETIDVNFSVFKMRGGGIYQYYKSSMAQLGLIMDTKLIPILTDKGKQLAQAYESNIRNTSYFKDFLESEAIPKEVLKEYGKISNFVHLKEHKNERDLLTDILFDKNLFSPPNIEFSRRGTLVFILDLFRIYGDTKTNLQNEDFRYNIHYGVSTQNFSYSSSSSYVNNIISYWRYFTFHNNLTYAIESILNSFILACSMDEEGITEKEFINQNIGFIDIISKYINYDIKFLSLYEVINCILKNCDIKRSFDILASKEFDKNVDITSRYSEFRIKESIKTLNQNNTTGIIGLSLVLLLINLIRYRYYIDTFDEKMMWIDNISEYEEFNQLKLYNEAKNEFIELNIIEFFSFILKKIIRQHTEVAVIKEMSYGLDTYRFIKRGDKYFFKKSYIFSERSDKFDAIKSILEDLGLIEYADDYYYITSYGQNILRRVNSA